ncbi:redoxin domain-containing protein [Chitinophagales bacterium]|jgi:peroxiredoxin|nr:redoxin domain-containing protein [Chitinophagales bacterium]
MKKYLFLLFIIGFSLSACNEEKDMYQLSGQIEGLNNEELILQFITFNQITDIDTTTSGENGRYSFKGKVKEPGFYRISGNGKYWMIRMDNEKMKMNAKFDDDLLEEMEIIGSEKAIYFQEVIRFFIDKQNELAVYGQEFQNKQMAGASMDELKGIENSYLAAEASMKEELKEKAKLTDDPIAGIYLLSGINSAEDIEFVKGKLNDYSIIMPNSTYIVEMREKIKANEDAIAQQAAMEAASKKIDIGTIAPDFTQKTPQGADLSLSSLQGQVVLLDFWASWCKPCRLENPAIVAAYNKYRSKGFTVLSVSLDKERNAWMNAIAQDGLIWPNHASDLQFWNNAAAREYGVSSIPAAFLIDENGVIIGRDLRGNALEEKLAEVLG